MYIVVVVGKKRSKQKKNVRCSFSHSEKKRSKIVYSTFIFCWCERVCFDDDWMYICNATKWAKSSFEIVCMCVCVLFSVVLFGGMQTNRFPNVHLHELCALAKSPSNHNMIAYSMTEYTHIFKPRNGCSKWINERFTTSIESLLIDSIWLLIPCSLNYRIMIEYLVFQTNSTMFIFICCAYIRYMSFLASMSALDSVVCFMLTVCGSLVSTTVNVHLFSMYT